MPAVGQGGGASPGGGLQVSCVDEAQAKTLTDGHVSRGQGRKYERLK